VALKLAVLRKEAALSQKEMARKVGTPQQQINRFESQSYEGHSLSMLSRVAEVLGVTVHVEIQRRFHSRQSAVAESEPAYGNNN
jgi:transcriptional regulator with XRE-family HTH domain